MIQINKSVTPPLVITNNGATWTTELLLEIKKYGSYSKLPDSVKKVVTERYKHSEIKAVLIPDEETKCAFCESIPSESGYTEIEHYYPKAIYPDETYSWQNLLPSCKRCNLKKLALDTGKYPIIKPDVENPEAYFTYENIKMVVRKNASDVKKAQRTIKRLELNQFRLIKPRSELLVSLVQFESDLEVVLDELAKSKSKIKYANLISDIMDSIDQIDELKKDKAKFSGFCRDYINKSEIINKAKKLIAKHKSN